MSIRVEGQELRPRQLERWNADHEDVVSESGRPMNSLRHGVIALLALPIEFTPDYPDLLMRCARHGDCVGNRLEILQALRKRHARHMVTPTGKHLEYGPPAYEYLPTKTVASQKVSRLKMDAMSIEEFERLRAANYRQNP
ncbi:hypothetical protein A5649_13490 [Mycolicibacter heraklionensis]|uniref:Uncharacterized protein n=1 Tax=Mycolicibacter heraklionensis TaxID=512402 RepID=A0AA91IZW3_9MYCO|nr:hypothetical protein [Mycolicibacter heraklionensis]OBK89458.1 hypothetical protein A5649_13490 [Mycolicibacter heraklionensis]